MTEIGIYGPFGIWVVLTYVTDGFLIDHEGTVRIIQGQVGDQEGIIELHHGCGNLGDWQL